MLLLRSKFRSILSLLLATPRIVPNTPQDDTLCCHTERTTTGRTTSTTGLEKFHRPFTPICQKIFRPVPKKKSEPQNFVPVFLLEQRISHTEFHDKAQALLPNCTNLALGRDFSTEVSLFTRRNRTLILTHKTSLFDCCD